MKNMNTDKLAINWQIFAQVRLQLKFAFIKVSINRRYKMKSKDVVAIHSIYKFDEYDSRNNIFNLDEIPYLIHILLASV